ncbi:hypothetical protein FIBSPDRAFT_895598 [Athelia psychrophila]|uniref:Uncharacterized protein n=1 Tax=Athelia psychrophila TaxID=1759441 RepID=A0A166EB81_9AGAM|nr:hypothetical protein FIBSPDRAFT_895598 [Fibularhizoctonia sp. CBS 109695]
MFLTAFLQRTWTGTLSVIVSQLHPVCLPMNPPTTPERECEHLLRVQMPNFAAYVPPVTPIPSTPLPHNIPPHPTSPRIRARRFNAPPTSPTAQLLAHPAQFPAVMTPHHIAQQNHTPLRQIELQQAQDLQHQQDLHAAHLQHQNDLHVAQLQHQHNLRENDEELEEYERDIFALQMQAIQQQEETAAAHASQLLYEQQQEQFRQQNLPCGHKHAIQTMPQEFRHKPVDSYCSITVVGALTQQFTLDGQFTPFCFDQVVCSFCEVGSAGGINGNATVLDSDSPSTSSTGFSVTKISDVMGNESDWIQRSSQDTTGNLRLQNLLGLIPQESASAPVTFNPNYYDSEASESDTFGTLPRNDNGILLCNDGNDPGMPPQTYAEICWERARRYVIDRYNIALEIFWVDLKGSQQIIDQNILFETIEGEEYCAHNAWISLAYAQMEMEFQIPDVQNTAADMDPTVIEFFNGMIQYDHFAHSATHRYRAPRLQQLLQSIIHQEQRYDHPIHIFELGSQESLRFARFDDDNLLSGQEMPLPLRALAASLSLGSDSDCVSHPCATALGWCKL